MGFTLQGFGPFLHWLTLGILCVFPVLAAYVVYKLGSLPGAIARSREHPQADAINICGWLGIITLVLWPIAMVWAHLAPGRPISGDENAAPEDSASLIAKLQQVAHRLADIESRLPPTGAGA
jgi:hypothetical protein